MALFKSYSPDVEVSGQIVLPMLEGMPQYKSILQPIFAHHGILNVERQQWYNLQAFLDILKDVREKIGKETLFSLGKLIAEFYPHQFDDVRTALSAVDLIYQSTHRNGDAGNCNLKEYDGENKRAIMEVLMPYPVEFARGVLVSMVRKYKNVAGLVTAVKWENAREEPLPDDRHIIKVNW